MGVQGTGQRSCCSQKILDYAARLKQRNIALLTVSDSFGSSGREQLKALAARKGFTVVVDRLFTEDTDMTALLPR